MNNAIYINLVIEDDLTEAVLRKLVLATGRTFKINKIYGRKGKSYIEKNLLSFNSASRFSPYLVVADLDNVECVPLYLKKIVRFEKEKNLILRIVVREIEAWLLADNESFSSFLGISQSRIPVQTDEIPNPKMFLLSLIGKANKKRLKDDLLPRRGSTAKIGPLYNQILGSYVSESWDALRAAKHSKSLSKAFERLCQFQI